jgi:thiamine-monophosphate kinase
MKENQKISWTEGGIIDMLRSFSSAKPEALGFFDDCAVFPQDDESVWLISKDCCVEGVHFLDKYFSPEEIAHKAFHSAVSDIAAMGGKPHYILLGLSLPQVKSMAWAQSFIQSLFLCAETLNISVIGGNTTRSPGPIFCRVTVIGSVQKTHIKKRGGAHPGNLLAVSGFVATQPLACSCLINQSSLKNIQN